MGRLYDATWGRLFAALYDRGLKATEEGGLGRMRAELLAGAGGRTIELGAGTGVNLDLYPEAVTELVLVEPDPHMGKRLRERLERSAREATIAPNPAEDLPFASDSFDTAVATLVLCTVPDPAAAVAELERVLKPGGRLLFIEHVRAADPGPGALAGPAGKALALPRRRLPLQPRHGRDPGRLAPGARPGRARPAAEVAADRRAPGPRQRRARRRLGARNRRPAISAALTPMKAPTITSAG